MSDYVIEGGAFERAYQKLAETGWVLNLQSAHRAKSKGKSTNNKTKFACVICGQNAWGKPDLNIICRPCNQPMMSAVFDGEDA
jgi:hypothetical protein